MPRLIVLMLCLLFIGGLPTRADNTQTIRYRSSSINFPNPERGFYIQRAPIWINGERTPITANELREARAGGITVLRAYYVLDLYRAVPLPPAVLAALQADLDLLRAEGFKMILRFAYNFPTNDDYTQALDAPLNIVLGHIDQLEPLLRANVDVIAHMDTGFVGAWGEWHSSSSSLVAESGMNDSSRAIVERLLAALPAERMIALRYPLLKQQYLDSADPLDAADAHNGSAQARIGAHEDCFLASANNWGTYLDENGEEQIDYFRNYLSADNRFLVQSGETCNADAEAQPFIGCDNALYDLAYLRWSTLNSDYHPDVLDGWRDGGCFGEIERRLGYRLRLIEAEVQTSGQSGRAWQMTLSLVNEGFAAPYNPRGFALLLRGGDGSLYTLPLENTPDPRFWLPGETITLDLKATLPADLPNDDYQLLLHLPDPLPSLSARPAYAVRLANADVWEADTGYNRLLAAVTVQNGVRSAVNAVPQRNYFADTAPVLTWSRVTWAVGYEVQVDDDSRFNSPVFSQMVDSSTLIIETSALSNGRYYWRARALWAVGAPGRWSAVDVFTVDVP